MWTHVNYDKISQVAYDDNNNIIALKKSTRFI